MSTQLLVNILPVTLASGGSTIIPHGLKVAGKGVVPTQVTCDQNSTIGVTGVDTLGVSFVNFGSEPATASFRAEYDHSIHAVNAVPMAWKGWDGTSFPRGPAGGDLAEEYPNPIVVGIQGIPVQNGVLPDNGDALLYNSTLGVWQHAPIVFGGGPPVGPASGDLGGIYPGPQVMGLQNAALPFPAVADGFVKRNAADTGWEEVPYGDEANTVCEGNDPRLSDARTPTGEASGDLDGTYPNPTVIALQGTPVSADVPVAGDYLRFDGTEWKPTLITPGDTAIVQGMWSDTTDQLVPQLPASIAVSYDTPEILGGVTLGLNGLGQPTRLTVPEDGVYSFQISPQLYHPGGTSTIVYFWAKVDGVNLPRSASSLEMGNNNSRTLPFLQLDLPMTAGQYLEWCFAQSGTGTTLEHFPATAVLPAIPSVIVTVKRFGAIP